MHPFNLLLVALLTSYCSYNTTKCPDGDDNLTGYKPDGSVAAGLPLIHGTTFRGMTLCRMTSCRGSSCGINPREICCWDCMALTEAHKQDGTMPACCILAQAESRGTADDPACLTHTTRWDSLTTEHLTAVATPRGGRPASGFASGSRE